MRTELSLEEEAVILMNNRERVFPGRQNTTYKARVSKGVGGCPGHQAITGSLRFRQSKDRSQWELGDGSHRKGMRACLVMSDSL